LIGKYEEKEALCQEKKVIILSMCRYLLIEVLLSEFISAIFSFYTLVYLLDSMKSEKGYRPFACAGSQEFCLINFNILRYMSQAREEVPVEEKYCKKSVDKMNRFLVGRIHPCN